MIRPWPKLTSVALAVSLGLIMYALSLEWPPHAREPLTGFWRDDYELAVYYNRIEYFRLGQLPNAHQLIEYPLFGVLYLTVPALVNDSFEWYRTAAVAENALMTLLLVIVTWWLLRSFGRSAWWLLAFALPTFSYFTLYRYDAFPALFVAVALWLLLRQRFGWSFFLLGIAVLAKGYPLMLFPIWMLYWLNVSGRSTTAAFFGWPVVLVIAPTLVTLIVLSLIVGFEQALYPYAWQASRQVSHGSALVLYTDYLSSVVSPAAYATLMYVLAKGLQLLQVGLPFLLFVAQRFFRRFIQTGEDVISWSLLVLLLFIQFFPYHSPQWYIWLFPWLPLFVRQRTELWLVLAIGLVGYVEFPLAFNNFGSDSLTHTAVVLLRTVLYVALTASVVHRIFHTATTSRATMRSDNQLATTV
ncbi:MAG: DUF2029 domain-containing protein [Candidatus Kerfeldbacteria bacterium]|nr:DUF2029 domain-containing protein [Candidatus Kerfeldbacteria bacterium]